MPATTAATKNRRQVTKRHASAPEAGAEPKEPVTKKGRREAPPSHISTKPSLEDGADFPSGVSSAPNKRVTKKGREASPSRISRKRILEDAAASATGLDSSANPQVTKTRESESSASQISTKPNLEDAPASPSRVYAANKRLTKKTSEASPSRIGRKPSLEDVAASSSGVGSTPNQRLTKKTSEASPFQISTKPGLEDAAASSTGVGSAPNQRLTKKTSEASPARISKKPSLEESSAWSGGEPSSEESPASSGGSLVQFLFSDEKSEVAGAAAEVVRSDTQSSVEESPARPDTQPGLPESPERLETKEILEKTPKKTKMPKEQRVPIKMELQMIGIPGVKMQEGEMVAIKLNRKELTTIAIYDAGIGSHVGWLPTEIVTILAPWLVSNPRVRMSGRVLSCKADSSGATEQQDKAAPDSASASVVNPDVAAPDGASQTIKTRQVAMTGTVRVEATEPDASVGKLDASEPEAKPDRVEAPNVKRDTSLPSNMVLGARMELVLTGPQSLEAELQALRERLLVQLGLGN